MDLDNLGPIIFFILYMAFSAWNKQKKVRERNQPAESPGPKPAKPTPVLQNVGGILEQLKKELFEEPDEQPLPFQQAFMQDGIELEPEEEEVKPMEHHVAPAPQVVEGSSQFRDTQSSRVVVELEDMSARGQSLEEVLEPYSRVQQGILLHEILGKPKAYQDNNDWFHQS